MKRKINGFTLVELLAVIVILAIIMIIAIPSVLSTMTTAKQKSFLEYVQKVCNKSTEQKLLNDEFDSIPKISEEDYIFYNIETDLGFDSTGDYKGYVIRIKFNHECDSDTLCRDSNDITYVLLWNNDYAIYWNVTLDGIPSVDRKVEATDTLVINYADNVITNIAKGYGKKVGDDVLVTKSQAEQYFSSLFESGLTLDDLADSDKMKTFVETFVKAYYTVPEENGLPHCNWWVRSFITAGNSTTEYDPFYTIGQTRTSCNQ